MLRKRRRTAAIGLAAAAAATAAVAAGPAGDDHRPGRPASSAPASSPAPPSSGASPPSASVGAERGRSSDGLLAAPIRIADAEVVRLLRPGDRVDVLATTPEIGWTSASINRPMTGPAGPPAVGAASGRPGSSTGFTGSTNPADSIGPTSSTPDESSPDTRDDRPGTRADRTDTESEHPDIGAPTGARVIARAARVAEVPKLRDAAAGDGALVVLSVPRETATALVSTGLTARLAVLRR
ncbi:hypothetical protein [Streptomyces zagrosensis]|uniref:Flp pilus assembly protein RcpC/CpaB domain-containing protein n=1 Tax=Streptomyces zagrosensis TaxID=1042984 RepID=A0A7W9QGR3_9ACTN|nr:hypothetical protein [Streptomyces zagrosensis]MBB5939816.1 hypothetical protein [Streptomyces zagrosensis]